MSEKILNSTKFECSELDERRRESSDLVIVGHWIEVEVNWTVKRRE